MRAELVHGPGEALVSGAATPDAFVVARRQGAQLADVSPALAELPAVALDIERHFGAAQDIEWAIENDRLWIVQVRPITTAVDARHRRRLRHADG
jgi:pyruvate,water dikinase